MRLLYRNALMSDLEIIVAIYNSTVASGLVTADTSPVSVESRLNWFADHRPEKRPLWMVENEEGQAVGWLSFQSFYGRPAYDATVEISIYLDEKFRGRGLGKEVLKFAIGQCPVYGIKTLLAYIFAHNEPSLKLFSSAGFESWARLPEIAEINGRLISLVILGKKL